MGTSAALGRLAIVPSSGGLPQFARPIDPVVRLPQFHRRRGDRRVTASARRRWARFGVVVGRRGDRQLRADRLDAMTELIRDPFDGAVVGAPLARGRRISGTAWALSSAVYVLVEG